MKPTASPFSNPGGLKGPKQSGQRISAGRKPEVLIGAQQPRSNHLPVRRELTNGQFVAVEEK